MFKAKSELKFLRCMVMYRGAEDCTGSLLCFNYVRTLRGSCDRAAGGEQHLSHSQKK
jgi:hypothetical protein